MKESRKELILELHSEAFPSFKLKIEKEFPKLFKHNLVIGEWYNTDGFLQRFSGKFGNDSTYGFKKDGVYSDSMGFHKDETHYLAANKEVNKAFEKEAVRLGIKVGSKVKCLCDGKTVTVEEIKFKFTEDLTNFWVRQEETGTWCLLFDKGKWAKIVEETITKEEAEKELGKTIIY